MSSSNNKKTSYPNLFVESLKSLPPTPKPKNQPHDVEKPKHQPTITSAEKRKNRSESIDAAYHEALQMVEKRKDLSDSAMTPLMNVLHFSSKDLAINREGDITEGQKKRIQWHDTLLHLALVGFAIFLFALAYEVARQSFAGNILTLSLAALGCGALAVIPFSIEATRKNLSTVHIVPFTGRVRKIGSYKAPQLMVIDYADYSERIFPVSSSVYNAFIDGETYTLYCPSYALHSFISAEHIPTGQE